MQANDIDRARAALQFLSADRDHDYWAKVGFAFHAAGGDFDTFDKWSATADSYKAQNTRTMWKSIKPGKGIGAGTLFKLAAENGYRMNGDRPTTRPKEATKRPAEPRGKPAKGYDSDELLARFNQVTGAHPYAASRGMAGDTPLPGMREVPAGDPLEIQGESMAGALVLPIRRADGSISSLQFITVPEVAARLKARGLPGKLNLPGATMEGWFEVIPLVPGGVVYICEGLATAWACWQATGAAAVVCFGWGRVRAVTAELRQRDATARLVICPDVGKEPDAEKIARELGCAVAAMPEGEAQNFDAGDLAARDEFNVLTDLLERAREPEPPPLPEPLLKPVSVFDVLTNPAPAPAFVWDGYLPRGTVALKATHGGVGKSTIGLMLGVCAPLGWPLFGVDTVACNVLFVSLEDGADIVRHRLAGICRAWGINPADLEGKLHIVDGTSNPELFSADARGAGDTTATYAELCKLVQSTNAGLVVVDNASDSFGGDEINRRQVRAFMRALTQVARLTNCAVLLLAHVDKGTSRAGKPEGGEGYSGSTAWHNSARSRIFMSRLDDGTISLVHQKSNLGKLREPLILTWPDNGLPMLADDAPEITGLTGSMQGRADITAATAILRFIAEYEGRGQYCSPANTSRNHVYIVLKVESAFKALKLHGDGCKRIVTQCQRAGWIEPLDYQNVGRKWCQRWTVTPEGRAFAGLPAPTAPTAPTCHEGAEDAESAGGAPTAPTCLGGVGESGAHKEGSLLEQVAAHD